jgi:formate-dependent nitrite reductase membrane component NrfD
MDRYVANPHWGEYIIAYFFLGGIAAGSYAMASLAALFGDETDRRATRVADYLAFPLVCVCGLLLVVDLGRPERFWHMMIASETFRPMFKWWSPMSIGSWGLSAFGGFSFVSFLGVLVEDRWIGGQALSERVARWRRSLFGKLFAIGGAGAAFFLGSYTGELLSATNQPMWSNTTWLGALFLASAASTGMAAMILGIHWRFRDVDHEALERLEWADGWAMAMEAAVLVAFAASLGGLARAAFTEWPGLLIPALVVPVGLVLPAILRRVGGPRGSVFGALLILAGGLVLRSAVVGIPIPFLVHP